MIYRRERIWFNVRGGGGDSWRSTVRMGCNARVTLTKRKEQKEEEEAPSGCNYLPHLNNVFVMIIIERLLTASTWDLTRLGEKQKLQIGALAKLPARPGWRCGRGARRPLRGQGRWCRRRLRAFPGSSDTFPDVASPFPKQRTGPRCPHARRAGERPHGPGRAAAGPIPLRNAGGAYGLVPRRGDGS